RDPHRLRLGLLRELVGLRDRVLAHLAGVPLGLAFPLARVALGVRSDVRGGLFRGRHDRRDLARGDISGGDRGARVVHRHANRSRSLRRKGPPITFEPMAERYDPTAIEQKWQRLWAEERTWEVSNDPGSSPASYVLEMLPYPSGEPHVGHLKNYAVGDAVAHFRRRRGERVLHPMGYDAFGLPAENNAIKTGVHPRVATEASIASYRRQFERWGISIDWSRELSTHDPRYYRWTQWIFLR